MVKPRARGEESLSQGVLSLVTLVISDYQFVSLLTFLHFNESVKNKNVLFSVEEVKLKVRDM